MWFTIYPSIRSDIQQSNQIEKKQEKKYWQFWLKKNIQNIQLVIWQWYWHLTWRLRLVFCCCCVMVETKLLYLSCSLYIFLTSKTIFQRQKKGWISRNKNLFVKNRFIEMFICFSVIFIGELLLRLVDVWYKANLIEKKNVKRTKTE